MWFQLAHPVKYQDGEKHNKQTQGDTGYVHQSDLLGEFSNRPSQSLKAACCLTLIDFAQDRCERHAQTAHSLESLRWENFRWTGLGQRPERGEKRNHPSRYYSRRAVLALGVTNARGSIGKQRTIYEN
jgi:hypothetical protein